MTAPDANTEDVIGFRIEDDPVNVAAQHALEAMSRVRGGDAALIESAASALDALKIVQAENTG